MTDVLAALFERVRSWPSVAPSIADGAGRGRRRPAGVDVRARPVRRRARRHAGMRSHARQTAVRADRMENGPSRSSVLPGHRLSEGGRVLRRAHELDDQERRWQAGLARHRRLGRPPAARRLSTATGSTGSAGTAGGRSGGGRPRRPGRWTARAAERGVRQFLLGHRAVGREEGRSRAAEARADAGGRQCRQGLPELPREGSGRLRPADQQRQPEEPPPGTGERQDLSAGAVRTDQLENGLARSHFVRGVELQGDRRLLHGAARLEAGDGRGQSEPV